MSELIAPVDLPLHVGAQAVARQSATATLTAWGFTDERWRASAILVVSEPVANAVRHGGRCLAIEPPAHEDQVTVSVADGSAVVPRRRDEHGRPDAESGPGIAIIEALSQRWGVEPHDGGKRVWVLLHTHPQPPHPGPATGAPSSTPESRRSATSRSRPHV